MQKLSNGLKDLSSLTKLNLKFRNNELGENSDNFRYLAEGLKGLQQLKILKLDLIGNLISDNSENMLYLG